MWLLGIRVEVAGDKCGPRRALRALPVRPPLEFYVPQFLHGHGDGGS